MIIIDYKTPEQWLAFIEEGKRLATEHPEPVGIMIRCPLCADRHYLHLNYRDEEIEVAGQVWIWTQYYYPCLKTGEHFTTCASDQRTLAGIKLKV